MDHVNRAIQGTSDLQQMMDDTLDIVLSIFECDRAFLLHPCDPDASSWNTPTERTRPEYPGLLALGIDKVPMDAEIARKFRTLLDTDGPVKFGLGAAHPLPVEVSERFGIKSIMSMALYPKMGKPWEFGIHQCSSARVWTEEDERLLREIGRRISDALTSFLAYRNLQESEERYRMVFENSPVSIWEEDFSGVKTLFDGLKKEGVVDIEAYFAAHPETIQQCAELAKVIDVNRAALALHEAASKDELLTGTGRHIYTRVIQNIPAGTGLPVERKNVDVCGMPSSEPWRAMSGM